MTDPEAIAIYQRIVGGRFRGVVLRPATTAARPQEWLSLHAYWVPDAALGEFVRYVLNELPEVAASHLLPDAAIAPVCASDTERYYPSIAPADTTRVVAFSVDLANAARWDALRAHVASQLWNRELMYEWSQQWERALVVRQAWTNVYVQLALRGNDAAVARPLVESRSPEPPRWEHRSRIESAVTVMLEHSNRAGRWIGTDRIESLAGGAFHVSERGELCA